MIDGQPVTDVKSQQWLSFLCYFGGQASFDEAIGQSGGGFNMATSSFAQAEATVDGESVDLTAWRTPGADANALVQYLSLFGVSVGRGHQRDQRSEINVAGKNVYTWTVPTMAAEASPIHQATP